jgi:putative transposase
MQSLYELTDSRWALIKTIIKPKERKRRRQLQLLVSDIVYLLQNGCKWESLPPFYGPYQTVWYYYHKRMVFGVLEDLLYKLSVQVRKKAGRLQHEDKNCEVQDIIENR